MNELVLRGKAADWHRLKGLVLDSVSSPITKRVYNLALDELIAWYGREPRPGFSKAVVSAWRVALEARGLGAISINVRITAARKLAVEAADNGLLSPELAAGIMRVKGVKAKGVRVGNWLSVRQSQGLLNAPDIATKKGLRDRAIVGVLLGCGLRRSEVASLSFKHIQQRDSRWCVVDLVGKHGRVRTVPMPTWVKVAIDAWTSAAGITDGRVFRPVNWWTQHEICLVVVCVGAAARQTDGCRSIVEGRNGTSLGGVCGAVPDEIHYLRSCWSSPAQQGRIAHEGDLSISGTQIDFIRHVGCRQRSGSGVALEFLNQIVLSGLNDAAEHRMLPTGPCCGSVLHRPAGDRDCLIATIEELDEVVAQRGPGIAATSVHLADHYA